jgi:hypothetical protein
MWSYKVYISAHLNRSINLGDIPRAVWLDFPFTGALFKSEHLNTFTSSVLVSVNLSGDRPPSLRYN